MNDKIVKTSAEKAGVKSVKQKEQEINRVLQSAEGQPKRRGRPAKAVPETQPVESSGPQIIVIEREPQKQKRAKRVLSEEQKAQLRERLVKARAAKKANRDAKVNE